MNDNEEYDVEETPETAEMAELLRNLPDVAMPEAVWNRLATALSAEAAPTVAAITAAPSARRRRWLPGAAVAGVAILATAVILPTMINTGANVAGFIVGPLVPWLAVNQGLGWVPTLGGAAGFALLSSVLWLFVRADMPLPAKAPS